MATKGHDQDISLRLERLASIVETLTGNVQGMMGNVQDLYVWKSQLVASQNRCSLHRLC